MRTLLIIDIQREWSEESSPYYVGDLTSYLAKVEKLIAACRNKGYNIIFTRHVEEEGSSFVDELSNLDTSLQVKEGDKIIVKHRISPFYKTDLEKSLQGCNQLIIAGILTNLCVRSAVAGAYDRDYNIVLVEDCCLAFDEETHQFTLKDLQKTREEITIISLEDFLSHKEF